MPAMMRDMLQLEGKIRGRITDTNGVAKGTSVLLEAFTVYC
jgi:hypothetical protein